MNQRSIYWRFNDTEGWDDAELSCVMGEMSSEVQAKERFTLYLCFLSELWATTSGTFPPLLERIPFFIIIKYANKNR